MGLLHQHHARQVVEVIVEASALASAMDWWGSGWRSSRRRPSHRRWTGAGCSIVEALASCSTSTTPARSSRRSSRRRPSHRRWTGGAPVRDCSIVEAIVEVLASCSTSTTSAVASAMESRAAGWGCSTSTTPARSSRRSSRRRPSHRRWTGGARVPLLHRRGAGQLLHQHHVGPRIGDGEDGHRWAAHRRGAAQAAPPAPRWPSRRRWTGGSGSLLHRRGAGELLHQHHVGPRIGDGIEGRGLWA